MVEGKEFGPERAGEPQIGGIIYRKVFVERESGNFDRVGIHKRYIHGQGVSQGFQYLRSLAG
jgi:hypothetical protein